MDWAPLIEAVIAAREHAYAPYSGFRVAAAVLTSDGRVLSGCNIENRSFGATLCAERVAIATALAAGAKQITAIAVLADTDPPAPPCGLCLQVLTEFAGQDLPVLLMNPRGEQVEYRLADLSPHPFQVPNEGLGRRSS